MTVEEILRQVSSGELSPEQALPLLDAAEASSTPSVASDPAADSTPAPVQPLASEPPSGAAAETDETGEPARPAWGSAAGTVTQAVTGVRVHASYRSVDIVADPSVAQVAVSGNHTVRHDGSTLVVESQDSPFSPPGEGGGRTGFSFADLPRSLAWAKAWTEQRLVVRVNPELAFELDAAGASVKVSGLEHGARLRVIASALKLERVRGPLDIDALSASVKGFAAPTGTSRITSESSSVKLILGPGTDVKIKARNRMGKVVLPTAVSKGGLVDPDVAEATVGAGRGELTIDAVMSSVVLSLDD